VSAAEFTGRCLCGAIRYRCGPALYPPTLCHCESCRRAAGAHAVAWLTCSARDYAVTAGEPVAYRSSPLVLRTFCGRCGTPLTYRHERRDGEIDVTLATLDEAGAAAPADHIWMCDALAWDRPADGLAQYPTTRGRS
jgi:hypothetical protein